MNLHEIGNKYGTDKVYKSSTHQKSTLNIYDKLFNNTFNLKDKLKILEIGVREGPSIKMLLDYFPNSEVYGLDIEECPIELKKIKRFHFIKGDQSKLEDLDKLLELCDEFDVIIDDGSHLIKDFIFTYNYLINNLHEKGIYIIEDLYNCYEFWNFKNPCYVNKNGEEFNNFISDLNYKIHHSRQEYDWSPIFSIQTYPGLLAIKKSL